MKAKRPGSDAHTCLYCHQDVGEKHLETCVLINRKVDVKMTIAYPIEVPASWDEDQINFHRNRSSWCADNALGELDALSDDDHCLCNYAVFEYVEEAGDAYLKEDGEGIGVVMIPDDEFGKRLNLTEDGSQIEMNRHVDEITFEGTDLGNLKTIRFDDADFTIPKTNCPEWGSPTDFYIQIHDQWEKRISDEIDALKGQPWNFIDIGANFGAYSFLAGRRLEGKIYAIEPFMPNYEILKYNVRDLPNVFPLCFAAGWESRLITLQVSSKNHGGHTCVLKRGRPNYQDIVIWCMPIDLLGVDCFDVVKIDVEGYAVQVLKGFERIREARLVMIEIHDKKEQEVISMMKGYGFEVEYIKVANRGGIICKLNRL